MAEYSQGHRQPTKEVVCPTCRVEYKGPGELVEGTLGKRCPKGHWYSLAHLNYFLSHGRLPSLRKPLKGAPSKEKGPVRQGEVTKSMVASLEAAVAKMQTGKPKGRPKQVEETPVAHTKEERATWARAPLPPSMEDGESPLPACPSAGSSQIADLLRTWAMAYEEFMQTYPLTSLVGQAAQRQYGVAYMKTKGFLKGK